MYAPPLHLSPDDFLRLLRITPDAPQLLGVSNRTIRQWIRRGAPIAAVRLLWYASPYGQEAAADDLAHLLRLVSSERDALRRQLAAMPARARQDVARTAMNDDFVPDFKESLQRQAGIAADGQDGGRPPHDRPTS